MRIRGNHPDPCFERLEELNCRSKIVLLVLFLKKVYLDAMNTTQMNQLIRYLQAQPPKPAETESAQLRREKVAALQKVGQGTSSGLYAPETVLSMQMTLLDHEVFDISQE
jgi:hypothetical protein